MNKTTFKSTLGRVIKYSYGNGDTFLHCYGTAKEWLAKHTSAYSSITVNRTPDTYRVHKLTSSSPAVFRTTFQC